jgi:hypothetical protein
LLGGRGAAPRAKRRRRFRAGAKQFLDSEQQVAEGASLVTH